MHHLGMIVSDLNTEADLLGGGEFSSRGECISYLVVRDKPGLKKQV